jgi:hypothetical protein
MSAELLQFGGSLVAVALLVLVAWRMRLGGDPEIADEAEARELADNALCGFEAERVALDRAGRGALLRDRAGRILLLAPHGFVGRLLDSRAEARVEGGRLVIAIGERWQAPATLELADAAAWCAAVQALD